jgi:hypothetical protein
LRWIAAVLLLTVPLQGLTAVARVVCGTAHAPATHSVSASGDALPHDHASHAHDERAGDHALEPAHSTADGASGNVALETGADACAHCADCSVGTALTGQAGAAIGVAATGDDFPARPSASPSRPFDGPERPPRTT